MGNITNVVIEFLTTEKDCVLISNEISLNEALKIGEREGVEIINAEGKRYKMSKVIGEKIHYIKY